MESPSHFDGKVPGCDDETEAMQHDALFLGVELGYLGAISQDVCDLKCTCGASPCRECGNGQHLVTQVKAHLYFQFFVGFHIFEVKKWGEEGRQKENRKQG